MNYLEMCYCKMRDRACKACPHEHCWICHNYVLGAVKSYFPVKVPLPPPIPKKVPA